MAKFIKKLSFSTVLSVVLLSALIVGRVQASETPTFPTCINPQGQIVASYDSGTHGVPGNTNAYTGKDTVYSLDNGNLMQCLCAENGEGVQTNWMKASGFSSQEVAALQGQGWILIPDGSAWGLDPVAYLAQNSGFTCGGAQQGGNIGGPGDGRSDGHSDGRSSGSVLGASTGEVLGLASTGNAMFILSIILTGTALFSAGLFLGFNKKK